MAQWKNLQQNNIFAYRVKNLEPYTKGLLAGIQLKSENCNLLKFAVDQNI